MNLLNFAKLEFHKIIAPLNKMMENLEALVEQHETDISNNNSKIDTLSANNLILKKEQSAAKKVTENLKNLIK